MDVLDPFNSKCICVNKCPHIEQESIVDVQHFSRTTGSELCEYDIDVDDYTKTTTGPKGPCPKVPVPARYVSV